MPGAISIGAVPNHMILAGSVLDSYAQYLFYDSFTDINGTVLDTSADGHTPNKGSKWTNGAASGTLTVSSGTFLPGGTDGDDLFVDVLRADHYAQAEFTAGDNDFGLIIQMTSSNVYMLGQLTSTNGSVQIYRNNSGFSLISNTAMTFANGDILRFEVSDSNDFEIYQNDTLVVTSTDGTNSTAGTSVGIRVGSVATNGFLDNFAAGISS